MASDRYALVVSGERFLFTRDQLESDPENYFQSCLLGDFKEFTDGARELVIEKEPLLFKIIQAHLRGYEILPLPPAAIPVYMMPDVALVNLYREAQYYGLQRLEERIKVFRPEIDDRNEDALQEKKPPPVKTYKFARYGRAGRWIINDVSSNGFQHILKTFASVAGTRLAVTEQLTCPGYALVACWEEVQDNRFVFYALLKSC